MKKLLTLLAPVVFLSGCDTATTQQMPRDPYVGRKVERMDGGQGTGVNHPDLDPGRYDVYGRTYERAVDRAYDRHDDRYRRERRYY